MGIAIKIENFNKITIKIQSLKRTFRTGVK